MKTTFELPDALVIEAKKQAAELRQPLRLLVERGLRAELASLRGGSAPPTSDAATKREIPWVTVDGGLPPELDVANRDELHEWLQEPR